MYMIFVQEEDLYLGDCPKYKADFLEMFVEGLLGDLSPMHRLRLGLGHDNQVFKSISFNNVLACSLFAYNMSCLAMTCFHDLP